MSLSFDKKKIRVVLFENISHTARAAFEKAGYTNVEEVPRALAGAELVTAIGDARLVGIRSGTHLDESFFNQAPKLMCVGCFCIGTNQVDLPAALSHGIPVFNAPFSNTRSVAELALSSTIALLRNTPLRNAEMHRGVWKKTSKDSHEARGKTLGIVGYGNIGTQLGILAEQLGMRIMFYDPEKKLPLGSAQPVSYEQLIAESDVISFHVPETVHTKSMYGVREIRMTKKGANIINYSRGSVVDLDALATGITEGHLRGAALDVYPTEPKSEREEFVSPVRDLDSVLLSPHVGGSTEEAQVAIGAEVAEKMVRYIDNGSTTGAVNFPNVALPQHPGAIRILNIHANTPGVLRAINDVFAGAGANIVGQFLQTSASIGYVVTDIELHANPETLRTALNAIEGTIKTRILQ